MTAQIKVFSAGELVTGITPWFSSYAAQIAWKNGLPALWQGESKNWKPGERVVLTDPSAIRATHVFADWGGRHWWWVVQSAEINAAGRIELILAIDPWLTHFFQDNLKLGAGHVERAPAPSSPDMDRAAIKWGASMLEQTLSSGEDGTVVACVDVDTNPDEPFTYFYAKAVEELGYMEVFTGKWIYDLKTSPDRVLGAWAVPISPEIFKTNWSRDPNNGWYGSQAGLTSPQPLNGVSRRSTLAERFAVVDHKGVRHLELPLSVDVGPLSYRFEGTPDTARVAVWDSTYASLPMAEAAGLACRIPCDTVTTLISDWVVYKNGQRQIDIEQSNINMSMAAWGGIASALGAGGASAGIGAAVGKGAGPAALVSTGTAMVGAAINYAVAAYYQPRLQDLTDRGHKIQPDALASVSGFFFDMGTYYGTHSIGIARFDMDAETKQKWDRDHSVNGFYWDETVTDAHALLPGPMRGDFEILGPAPAEAKNAIREMFRSGARVVAV